jgi:glucan phosphoethanolaminetransferase (alkaline phosphatase superfamily)
VVSGITCYFYRKVSRALKEIELKKEFALKQRRDSTSIIAKYDKRMLTTPELAAVSLFTIFIIHCITQLPMYIYGIIVSSMALHNRSNETADNEEDTPILPAVGSVPILFLLAIISFLTTSSPLVLCCINRKYKQQIKSILRFITGCGEHVNEDKFLHQIQAMFPPDQTPPSPILPSKPAPNNIEIFYGRIKHSPFSFKKNNGANYITSSDNLEVPGALRPERVSESSLQISRSPRPNRISTTSSSVGRAAVNAGLVLSAPGHRILLNNFFPPDPSEAMAEELDAINFL